ncbi:MAG: hypothetical protein RLZZ210_1413 [Pseudomonadota bacterium]|jgi:deoxyribodipyrimidine photo-lyase
MLHNLGLVWLRRDLRLNDNAALYHALHNCKKVVCVFIFDSNILSKLDKEDRRLTFIYESIQDIKNSLNEITTEIDKKLLILHGNPTEIIPQIAHDLAIDAVFTNHDYEQYAINRDNQIQQNLSQHNISFYSYKDQVISEKLEVLSKTNSVYTVFTPYKKAWLQNFANYNLPNYVVDKQLLQDKLNDELLDMHNINSNLVHSLEQIGFVPQNLLIKAGENHAQNYFNEFLDRINNYHNLRDFPSVKGVSYLSTHLRFGTISIRQLVHHAYNLCIHGNEGATTWLSELIWREFFMQILSNFSYIEQGKSFNTKYDNLVWRSDEKAQQDFGLWCKGETGYPIVDAAMRQLNHSGYMHNRLRMVSASFLIKNMGIDWRWGEAYFAKQLLDFDFSANNGGWQWCASTGCDAQPYFRIFNPMTQSEKFDAQAKFIKKYIPELENLPVKYIHAPWEAPADVLEQADIKLGKDYPFPIVDYKISREQTLARYKMIGENNR